MDSIVVKPENFDVNKLDYGEMKDIPNVPGAKMIYVNYENNDTKKTLHFQTPWMNAPFGLSQFTGEKSKGNEAPKAQTQAPKFTLDLSFNSKDEKCKELLKMFKNIDKEVKKRGCENSKDWLKKKYSKEFIEEFYKSNIKSPKDNDDGTPNTKYDPTLKIKVPMTKNGEINIKMFDKNKEQIMSNPLEVITKGCKVQALIRLKSIWITGGKFGYSLELVQVKVQPSAKLCNYAFNDESGDESENDNNDVKSDSEEEVKDVETKKESKKDKKNKNKNKNKEIEEEEEVQEATQAEEPDSEDD